MLVFFAQIWKLNGNLKSFSLPHFLLSPKVEKDLKYQRQYSMVLNSLGSGVRVPEF